MKNTGNNSFLRSRRLESFVNRSSDPSLEASPKELVKDEGGKMQDVDAYVDDDGWVSVLISCIRLVLCFTLIMVTTFIWAIIMLLLLPWPYQRIRQGNVYGHVTGRFLMLILGNPIKIEGVEFSKERAIFISNHASILDVFLMIWLISTGTVDIAKKEIIWYPLFGQIYILANHLRIDRSNRTAAIESMKEGFLHLALQTRLPIVPIVLKGTHLAWRKGSLRVQPSPLTVKFLPPIRTDDWTVDKIEEYVKIVRDVYVENLPEQQRPLVLEDPKRSLNS